MEKTMKQKNKGITLIALIITIIVMLILVVVSVRIALNTGLFESAGKAAKEWKTVQEAEAELGNGKINIGGTTYGSIDEYIQDVGKTWEVIYNKGETTIDGELLISEDLVFDDVSIFRITVSSEEYTGMVTLAPILGETDSNSQSYGCFFVRNGETIIFNSLEDMQNKLSTCTTETLVIGVNIIGTGTMIRIMTADGENIPEYTIKKVEKANSYENRIFSGEMSLPCENLGFNLKKTNRYIIKGKMDGMSFTTMLQFGKYILALGMVASVGDEYILYEGITNAIGATVENAVINEIYDMGDFPYYKEENGFGLYYTNERWCLIDTPNTEYVIPTTVDGITVDEVWIDWLDGIPAFNNVVDIGTFGDPVSLKKVIVNVNDSEMIDDIIGWCIAEGVIIDLTGCGDDVDLEKIDLDYFEGDFENAIIYVTEAVKAKYADYDLIKVKSE